MHIWQYACTPYPPSQLAHRLQTHLATSALQHCTHFTYRHPACCPPPTPGTPHPCHREVKLEVSVSDYFHEDGYLAEAKWSKDVAKLLKQYQLLDASSAPRPKALNPGSKTD